MCNIAGYVGDRRAAPILIDMIRRQQYIDGGVETGIATIHEGKLYHAKVVGDLDVFLRETDAINFPGTVGIMHSRPGGTLASHAHPFLDKDEKMAMVYNGTITATATAEFLENSRIIMQGYLDKGYPLHTFCEKGGGMKPLSNGMRYHPCELWTLYTGEVVDRAEDVSEGMLDGVLTNLDTFPSDRITLAIHAMLDGVITAGRTTRPMVVGLAEGESYLATTALAFPEDVTFRSMTQLPVCSVSQIRAGSFTVSDRVPKNIRVEEPTAGIYKKCYDFFESRLKDAKDSPRSIYDMDYPADFMDMWSQPMVDCIYAKEGSRLKPSAAVMYEVLWAFYKEGRLHWVDSDREGKIRTKFWLE